MVLQYLIFATLALNTEPRANTAREGFEKKRAVLDIFQHVQSSAIELGLFS